MRLPCDRDAAVEDVTLLVSVTVPNGIPLPWPFSLFDISYRTFIYLYIAGVGCRCSGNTRCVRCARLLINLPG